MAEELPTCKSTEPKEKPLLRKKQAQPQEEIPLIIEANIRQLRQNLSTKNFDYVNILGGIPLAWRKKHKELIVETINQHLRPQNGRYELEPYCIAATNRALRCAKMRGKTWRAYAKYELTPLLNDPSIEAKIEPERFALNLKEIDYANTIPEWLIRFFRTGHFYRLPKELEHATTQKWEMAAHCAFHHLWDGHSWSTIPQWVQAQLEQHDPSSPEQLALALKMRRLADSFPEQILQQWTDKHPNELLPRLLQHRTHNLKWYANRKWITAESFAKRLTYGFSPQLIRNHYQELRTYLEQLDAAVNEWNARPYAKRKPRTTKAQKKAREAIKLATKTIVQIKIQTTAAAIAADTATA